MEGDGLERRKAVWSGKARTVPAGREDALSGSESRKEQYHSTTGPQ